MSKTNELIQRFLGEPARNLMHAMYDDYVEANVRFRSRSGMKTFIIRRQLGKCCDWCAGLAGIYESDKAPDGIYQRHDNCKCMVTFRNEKGKYIDVWSKRENDSQRTARINAIENLEMDKVIKSYNGESINYKRISKDYLTKKRRAPGILVNEYAGLSDENPEEWAFAQWVHSVFGGNIIRKKDIKTKPNNPDFEWNGKLWDLKSPKTTKYNTLDGRICEGLKQIGNNPGGLMLCFDESDLDFDTAETYVIRILGSKAKKTTDVIIKKGNRFSVTRVIKE